MRFARRDGQGPSHLAVSPDVARFCGHRKKNPHPPPEYQGRARVKCHGPWAMALRDGLLRAGVLLTTMVVATAPGAAAAIPPDKQIPASVVRTISAPADNPLVMPTDVAIDPKGAVYIADGVNDRIVCLGPDGQLKSELRGPADSPLSRPVAVALDAAGAVWIADTGNQRLLVLAPDAGNYRAIDLPPGINNKPANPTGLAVRSDGAKTYLADCDNHRVLVLDNARQQWTALGAWGTALGQFRWPFMLAIGADNYVQVTESVGARVQQISPDNLWAGQMGRFGVALGDLHRPKGVAVDSAGRIFVGDSTLGVIQVFSPRGSIRGVLSDDAGLPLRLQHPMGMRFDAKGLLYVVELAANRVAVITLKAPNP